ncbi:larval cuticle protein LCP-17 [Nomia melanderi]|uniref:larval cuticle protein LCP-17 n=1 Tax=Nomia melanderi TaxID=2448451 RepID=UPI001303F8EB|nr:larval cuticle protein LCP-17-like [Nomia melanderi]
MKFFILSFVLVAAVAGEVLLQAPAAIVRQTHDSSTDGSYSFSYETENGIFHAENGSPLVVDPSHPPVVTAQGQYQYTAPDGTPIAVSYVADHNGYQPQGAHIPQISPLIQRALEYIRAHPAPVETHTL